MPCLDNSANSLAREDLAMPTSGTPVSMTRISPLSKEWPHGHGKLCTAHATADHRHWTSAFFKMPYPACGKGSKRLGGDAMLRESRKFRHVRRDAYVQRRDVVGHERATLDRKRAFCPVNARDMSKYHAGVGKPCQPDKVDLQCVTRDSDLPRSPATCRYRARWRTG